MLLKMYVTLMTYHHYVVSRPCGDGEDHLQIWRVMAEGSLYAEQALTNL